MVSPSLEKRGVEFHDLSASLSVKYDFAILQAGGIPMTAPVTTDLAILAECVRRVEGVLLTGGDALALGDDYLDWILTELEKIPHIEIMRLGSRMVIRRGAGFVRPIFIAVALAITARLIWQSVFAAR